MEELNGKKVLILQQRGWGLGIGKMLAKNLHREGAKLAALTFKRTTDEFIRAQTDVPYELVLSNDDAMEDPLAVLGEDRYSLDEICNALGVESVWAIFSNMRNYVRSYGGKYYYDFKQNVSDEDIKLYIQAVYKNTKKLFDEFGPDVIVSPNFVSFVHIFVYLYAKKRGVTMLGVTDCKVNGQFIFTTDYLDSTGSFYDRFEELQSGKSSENAQKAKEYISSYRKKYEKPSYANKVRKTNLKEKVKSILRPFYYSLLFVKDRRSKNRNKIFGYTIDYMPPKIIFRDEIAKYRYKRASQKRSYADFEKVGKYIYMPLQFQPEANIDVTAPFFSNQIETARQVAMSLPGEYTLVVKDHPEMVDKRPPSYIEKIARTPNVTLLDPMTPGDLVFKKADMIVSATGTTLAEAAFYNKPAIQLGELGTNLLLPNIIHHTDMTTLAKVIVEHLNKNLNTPEYEKQLENFVAAAYDTGFSLEYVRLWEDADDDISDLWKVYRREIVKYAK